MLILCRYCVDADTAVTIQMDAPDADTVLILIQYPVACRMDADGVVKTFLMLIQYLYYSDADTVAVQEGCSSQMVGRGCTKEDAQKLI